ncbi:PIN domain-containing protein [Actinomycetospora atypica]|uniref:PIN domain-containing protein n=1 Tax=Actinomycetospora atypica TaxID=1290095 RepID=A0ABV9YTT9_9PSEU
MRLLVPELVLEEFDRNRPHAEERAAKSISDRVRDLGRDLDDIGVGPHRGLGRDDSPGPNGQRRDIADFREIRELLERARRLEPRAEHHERVVRRALGKLAPFHLPKNSVGDALLAERYRTTVAGGPTDETFAFVTSNYRDFSAPGGDQRQPHPDLAELFDGTRSRYCLGPDGLRQLLTDEFGEAFHDEVADVEFVRSDDEPRTYGEILAAAEEYLDKVWYVRHLIQRAKEERGEETRPMPADIRAGVEAAAQRVVERYGAENVGPWDDWGWDFVNGQLAALRWVLGTDWGDAGLLDT